MKRVIAAALLVGLPNSLAFAQADAPILSDQYFLERGSEAAVIGDLDAAAQYFQSAIIYAPANPVAYHRLGQLYARNGQRELAQQFFALALNVEPAFAPALEGLALLDLAAGNRAGAEAQRDILLRACGATCPETAQVERALNAAKGTPAN
jgi:tetratricopeptide (TPR) repeat protein